MTFSIVPVFSGLDLEQFVTFPFSLYATSPFWVPPLVSDDRLLLSPVLHPFWNTAKRRLFLAKSDGRIIGRIAAIIDTAYNQYVQERCGAFGFFECIDDEAVAHALLKQAANWLTQEGMDYMRGPVNPSTNYTCGLLVDGFTTRPATMMPWNPPYYHRFFESWGLHKEEDLFAYR
ncbi:MAG: hypothetical protein J5803_02290, partial [Desulfovibrio sp.]|nr:hypothetical protein [Desulfovibrio sp.]